MLLLRTSVAFTLLLEDHRHGHELSGWVQGAVILVSVALLIGYLTPIATLAALLFQSLLWYELGDSLHVETLVGVDALALALLGPGAFSLDSYLFGRRVVVLPPDRQ